MPAPAQLRERACIVPRSACDVEEPRRSSDIEMTRRLVEEKGVAAIPPSVFYARPPGPLPWLRFAFCKKDETLALAAQRLTSA